MQRRERREPWRKNGKREEREPVGRKWARNAATGQHRQMRGRMATAFALVCLSLVLRICVAEARQSLLQRGIAEEVLRFHVLANSDSARDQETKLKVRDRVLEWLKEELERETGRQESGGGEEGEAAEPGDGRREETEMDRPGGEGKKEETAKQGSVGASREGMAEFLGRHLEEIEEVANQALKEQGAAYRVAASLEVCWFPDRTYGGCTFPAGYYEALRIALGDGAGHNWWCVLYPRLCFSDCLRGVWEDGELEKLEEALTGEEYEELLRTPSRWQISFRWF